MDEETLEHWRDVRKGGFLRFVLLFGFTIFLAAAALCALGSWLAAPGAGLDGVLLACVKRLAWLPVIGMLLAASVWPAIGGRA